MYLALFKEALTRVKLESLVTSFSSHHFDDKEKKKTVIGKAKQVLTDHYALQPVDGQQ